MVSVGASGGGMHARVDLPHDPDDVDDVVEALLRPARRNGVRDVVVVVYDDETTVADEAAWSVHEEFTAAGIGVREVLRVHDDHWYAVLPGAPLAAYRGVPFTRAEHPFTAQAVFEGRVTHASREALRETVAPDAGAVARSLPHLVDATPLPPGGLTALVRRHVRAGTTFSASELASVAASVGTGRAARRGVGVARARRCAAGRRASGPTPCAAFRPPTWPVPPPSWPSRRGSPVTAPCRGVPSTGAASASPPTRWRASSRSCSSPPLRRTRGRRCSPSSGRAADPAA